MKPGSRRTTASIMASGGDLSAVQHEVAQRHLAHVVRRGGLVDHALVDALVAAAREDQVLGPGQLARDGLGERGARSGSGTTSTGRPLPAGPAAARASSASPQGSGFITMPAPAAVRRVVDGAVTVVGPVAQVVDGDVDQAATRGPCRSATASSEANQAGKIVTTSILTQASSSGNGVTRPGRSATTTRPASTSTSGTSAATNGTSASRPSGVRIWSRSCAPWSTPVTSPSGVAVEVDRREPHQLVVVELVGVVRRLVGRDGRRAGAARAPTRRPCGRSARRNGPAAWTGASASRRW